MNNKKIFNIALMALFTALAFVGTLCKIDLPTGDMVHLGNFICILAALLLGGVKGGICGSLGMGLFDICFYFDSPSTIVRTFILKFLMGFIAGAIFKTLREKDKKSAYILLFTLLGLNFVLLTLSLVGHLTGYEIVVNTAKGVKIVKINYLVPTVLGVFMGILGLICLYIKNKSVVVSSVAIAASIASIVNVSAEFIFRVTLSMIIDNYGFMPSVINAFSKIPGGVLTSTLTVIVSTIVYPILYNALAPKYKEYLI